MIVELSIKEWSIGKDSESNPRITGRYSICMGGKEIAIQAFNSDYADKKILFSSELMATVSGLTKEIQEEIMGILSS